MLGKFLSIYLKNSHLINLRFCMMWMQTKLGKLALRSPSEMAFHPTGVFPEAPRRV